MTDMIDRIIEWLMLRALRDHDLSETIQKLATRLLDGGIPISRIVVGRTLSHPVIGLTDLTWNVETRSVAIQNVPRKWVQSQIGKGIFETTPFGYLLKAEIDELISDVSDPNERARFPIFEELAANGTTGYAAFSRSFRRSRQVMEGMPEHMEGATISFCTRRIGGFSESDLNSFRRILLPLCACIRVATDRLLVTELLETYLGRLSGKHVFTGQSERGDGRRIECVLFYSDMRDSVAMSTGQTTERYIATLNTYFDCTAGAVADHGGEVLKFIGDGVLAIFPVDEETRPRANMCAAALSAARDAFARAAHANEQRSGTDSPAIRFGIGLHMGDVIYGNVGTEKRLDFTATGPAVGLVSRCEALTREADCPLVATREFADHCVETGTPLGSHQIKGLTEKAELIGYTPDRP